MFRETNNLREEVVDRGGLPYSKSFNNLGLANRPDRATEARHVPKLLANQNGPVTRLVPRPGPTTTSSGGSHG